MPEVTPEATPDAPAETTPAPADAPSDAADATPADATPADATPEVEDTPAPVAVAPPPRVSGTTARTVTTASLRTDPSTDALITGSIPAGVTVQVLGCSSGCSWLLVQVPGGGTSWSASFFFSVQGSPQSVPSR